MRRETRDSARFLSGQSKDTGKLSRFTAPARDIQCGRNEGTRRGSRGIAGDPGEYAYLDMGYDTLFPSSFQPAKVFTEAFMRHI